MKGLTAVIGIIGGFAVIVWGMTGANVPLIQFWQFASILIVVGGTLGATLTSFTISQLLKGFSSLKQVLFPPVFPYSEMIVKFRDMADLVRQEGTVGLQRYEDEAEDNLMRDGIIQILSGASSTDELEQRLEPKLDSIRDSSKSNQEVFAKMGMFSPAFGMAGTLIGLIAMLATLKDPSGVGPKMALALITTLYGVLLANLVFIPLASRIAQNTEAELQYKALIIHGLLAILDVETGAELVDKLRSHVPPDIPIDV